MCSWPNHKSEHIFSAADPVLTVQWMKQKVYCMLDTKEKINLKKENQAWTYRIQHLVFSTTHKIVYCYQKRHGNRGSIAEKERNRRVSAKNCRE